LRVPLSCGLLRPTVVVPASLCEDRAALRWVLAHELTHLRRRDVWTCVLFAAGEIVYFYLPWFWWLRRQVRLCQESLADAAAARRKEPEDYAAFLLSLTRRTPVLLPATGIGGGPSDLFRRVRMLLQSTLRLERRCPRLWSVGVGAVLIVLA